MSTEGDGGGIIMESEIDVLAGLKKDEDLNRTDSEGIEISPEKDYTMDSAHLEVKCDAIGSPDQDGQEVSAAVTSSIAVVNDGNPSSDNVKVETDGDTGKTCKTYPFNDINSMK